MITALLRPVFVYLIGVVALTGGLQIWMWRHDAKVTAAATAKIDNQAEKISEEALAAREPAYQPGSFDRLRRGWCVDCNCPAHQESCPPNLHP